MPVCSECKQVFASIKQISFHFSMVHYLNYEPSHFKCAEENCFFEATYLKHLKEHWRNIHKLPKDIPALPSAFPKKSSLRSFKHKKVSDDSVNYELLNEDSVDNTACSEEMQKSSLSFKDAFQSKSLKFISNLYANSNLPRNCVQLVIENSNMFFSDFASCLKEKLSNLPVNLSDDMSMELNEFFSVVENPFINFDTEYKRLKYFRELGAFIEPKPVFLGMSPIEKKINGITVSVPTSMKAQYISAPKLLLSFFNQSDVLLKTLNYMKKLEEEGDVCISNVIQGSHWKSRFNNCGKIVIPIFFCDAFEAGNALGSHAGIHSISGGYLSVACLPLEYRGSLDNIFVTLLFNSQDRKDFGNERVFKPLIADLKNLEENGLNFHTPALEGKVFFALANLLGDNLGLHEITDFVGSFTAKHPCFWCRATKEQTTTLSVEKPELMRTIANYNEDVATNNYKVTGIHRASIWNVIPSFHVVEGTAPDLMHDGPEGVCHYIMIFIIKKIVENKSPDLKTLNFRIKNFDYGPCVSNKPPLISEQHLQKTKLRMSASEMLCFVRFFSLIIGDMIPEGNKIWGLYLKLKQLIEYLLAPSIQKDCAALLELYISELNIAYHDLSGETLKNKFHHLTHYPNFLRKFGPCVNLWVFRFDGKHRMSKKNANVVAGRVNPQYTLAVNSQLNFQTSIFSDKFLNDLFEWGSEEIVSLLDELQNFPSYLVKNNLLNTEGLKVSWIKCYGTRYSSEMVLIYDIAENLPCFAEIVDIYVVNKTVLFQCAKLEITDINGHYICFRVRKTGNLALINQENLIDPIPTCISRNALNLPFVTIRHVV